MPILHFLKRRKENAVFGHRSRGRMRSLISQAENSTPCCFENALARLKRRKVNAVFGHRSRRENALAHLARGKQHTVLFLERPCSTLAERFFGTKKIFANQTRPPVKTNKVVPSQTSKAGDHLLKMCLILLVGDGRILREALARELLASSARPKPLLPHAARIDGAPLGTRVL